ncbi:alpha-tocopherol transfer protein-like [Argiope bruennichi]|uniref:alpha-tocopherol transfer protein-like n=1 Tax=Argiope bruennichi TaxID=94029 RepID=UPI00249594DF|nr:alpha-tocopherol transfer protein-like [Argiope bruennichi]XP_055943940.1 alpha-tocopherol transfer protein-like [Argiope bruennichi]XP_055943941.1 alpha-tocopherol transfer protein-like [Argiope bruennichi]
MAAKYHEYMKSKNFLPFTLDRLPQKMVQKAKDELRETDEIRGLALEQLRKLVLTEKNLKCPTEDEYLIQFLRARKFDVKKAFTLLQTKYQVRKAYAEVYDDIDVNELRKVVSAGIVYCFPYRDADGCVVVVMQLSRWNPDDVTITQGLCALTGLLLRIVDDPAAQICGIRVLVDVRGFSMKQVRCVTPRYITLLSKALRNCLPIRFKGIHIYNETIIFQYVWSILKLFLSDKIKGRVHFHGDSQKSLHKLIPKEILSSDYGGDHITFDGAEYCATLMEPFYEKFLKMANGGYL